MTVTVSILLFLAEFRRRCDRAIYDALRELGFVPTQRDGRRRGWPGEKCKRCGRRNVVGFIVPDEVWMAVVGASSGCWCLTCFDEEAQAKGIAYRVRPEDLAQVSWDMWRDFDG